MSLGDFGIMGCSQSKAAPDGGGASSSSDNSNKHNGVSHRQSKIERFPERKLPRRASQQSMLLEKRKSLLTAESLADVFAEYNKADPKKWKVKTVKFNGNYSMDTNKIGSKKARVEDVQGLSIKSGIDKFKSDPNKYFAMIYPTVMIDWPANEQQYKFIHRSPASKGFKAKGVNEKTGQVTLLLQNYQCLPSFKDDTLPKSSRDKYTDTILTTYEGKKLTTKPYLPGRGMGFMDEPNLKIIGDVDPSDIQQGNLGDCWLLSGIASLAEYDGAIRRLFRKTTGLGQMPFDSATKPNSYTITLWDLQPWKEVDVVVDERLPTMKDPNDNNNIKLLGAKNSDDGELWVCYLEKAIAAHCGGYDKIGQGGDCTHAWSILTGCKQQYIIQRNPKTKKFGCCSKYNPTTKQWAKYNGNSPFDCVTQGTWPTDWPKLGGGGDSKLELTEDELFLRLCAWDDENYLIGTSSKGVSDTNSTNGIVDNHAYSIVDCRNDVAGILDMDLIQIRNPWGHKDSDKNFANGKFATSNSAGWKKHPQVRKELNPPPSSSNGNNNSGADDGVFWVTKEEFFQHYETIYLCESSMTKFLGTK